MEYAMITGTTLDGTNEANMLTRWHKPWLFWRVLLGGLAFMMLCVIITLLLLSIGTDALLGEVMLVIGPMVVPVALMILFWELNIPRNISIYELLACFVIGAVIAFLTTGLLYNVFSFKDESVNIFLGAPLREEPAKLISSVVILYWFSRKAGRKIYGLTGLVVGAAVGTGFSAFETIQYGMQYGIVTILLRMVYAVVGHTVFCAPYAAAVALHMRNNRLSGKSFLNTDFALTFAAAFLTHMFWNSNLLNSVHPIKFVLVIAVTWSIVLYITRKCLQQAVLLGSRAQWDAAMQNGADQSHRASKGLLIETEGLHAGTVVEVSAQGIYIGRDQSCCTVCFRGVPGVSARHCMLQYDANNRVFLLYDLNSSYGTFLPDGTRVLPGTPAMLKPGAEFNLARTGPHFRVMVS